MKIHCLSFFFTPPIFKFSQWGKLSLVVKEGWPIRGLELIMWHEGQWAVMSTNIQIFEYLNKMALEYYSYRIRAISPVQIYSDIHS